MNFLKKRYLTRLVGFCILISIVATHSALAKSKGQSALDLGTKLYREGRYREAVKTFKDATKLDPALIRAWENLGWAYHKSGQTKEALRILETVLKVEPGNLKIQNAVGFLFMTNRQWRRAIPHLKTSLEFDPKQNLVRIRLGKAYRETGQYDRAVKLFKLALKFQPNNLDALLPLASIYENLGHRDLAISAYKNYLSSRSNVFKEKRKNKIAGRLSVLLAKQGDESYRKNRFQQAEEFYKQALNLRPDNIILLQNLGWALEKQGKYNEAIGQWKQVKNEDVSRVHQIANAYYHSGQTEEAENWYQKTANLDPAIPSVQFRLFDYALKKNNVLNALIALQNVFVEPRADQIWSARSADRFIHHGSLDRGIKFFLKRLPQSSHPEITNKVLGKLHLKKGVGEWKAGKVEQAILDFEKAVFHDGLNAIAYRDLGWLYWRADKREENERVWKQYRKKFPDKTEPYDLLARFYLKQREYGKSLMAVASSLKIDSDQPVQKLIQAKALNLNKQYPEAMERVNRMVREYPDFLSIQYFYGEILMQSQDFKRGKVQWRKVLDMGAKNPRAYFYWIKSLYETGEYEKAIRVAKFFLDQNDPYRPVMKFLVNDALIRQDKKLAVVWYEKLLKNFGDHSGDWLELAKLYEEMNHPTQAMDRLKEAERKFPADVDIQVAIGDLNLREGEFEEALTVYRDISRMNPDNRRAFIGTFHALKAVGRMEEAIRHLQANDRLFLKDYEINLEMGNLMVTMKDSDAAKSFYSSVATPAKRGKYVPILLYHGLSGHPRSRNLWVQRFDHQLKALADAGYTTLTVAELGNILNKKLSFPEKPVLITFDDARRDAFRLGDPVLKKYGMKATMFIPTSRIHKGGPFFADWDRTRGYVRSGRWDLQAHGHKAHDLVSIDSKGDEGNFLNNAVWLNKKNRQETVMEFYARLDGDYQQNIKLLQTEIPGLNVVGYAYPFSEAGQSRSGNVNSAGAVNQALLEKYFKFGFIQDQTGYNWVKLDDTKTSLLRRFSVPRNWDGDQLIHHLAETHPSYVAQLALAKSQYWNGRYSDAGEIFSDLVTQEPGLKNKVQIYLADISYQGGNYWESEKLLQDIPIEESVLNPKVEKLKDAVAWKTRPRVFGGFNFFHDSNDRTNHFESTRIYFPLKFPLELRLEGALINFERGGRRSLDGKEVSAGINWSGWKSLRLDGKFRNRDISQKNSTQSYWVSAQYLKRQHKVQLNGSDRDIDTVRAIENSIQVKTYSLGYQNRFSPLILGKVGLFYQDYDDGNTAFNMTTGLRYTFPELKNWKIGVDLSYKDTEFATPAYYTPDQLLIGSARVLYQRRFGKDVEFKADLGIGGANDKVNGLRWVTNGGFNFDYSLTKKLKAGLATKYSVVPGYNSVNMQAVISYRY